MGGRGQHSSRCIRVAVAPPVPHLVAPPIPRNINDDDTSGFLWLFVRFGGPFLLYQEMYMRKSTQNTLTDVKDVS